MGLREIREEALRAPMEALRTSSGAFRAAAHPNYNTCWLRDQIYTTSAYYYLGEHDLLRQGIWVAFDILHKQSPKMEKVTPPDKPWEYIHAKYDAETLGEVTRDWGHHQLDALGIFLHVVADLHSKHIEVIRGRADEKLLQLIVQYLEMVRYWEKEDTGMWEVGWQVRSSSLGAVVRGLTYIHGRDLAVVKRGLIDVGRDVLERILPEEFRGRFCDLAQLSLIWPYNIVSPHMRDEILRRIDSTLAGKNGLRRFGGDDYPPPSGGGEWPMGFFWRSIIASQMNDVEQAKEWFERGIAQMTKDGEIPELYQNGKPNKHTPLAWAHALAIIALRKLGDKQKILTP